jgi:hypothetical protein
MQKSARLLVLSGLLVATSMLVTPDRGRAAAPCADDGQGGQVICVNQEQIDFGVLPSGQVAVRTVTVTNLTAADRPFGGLVLRGPEAFDVVRTTCTLPSGARGAPAATSCEISIGFAPSGAGLNERVDSTLLITSPTNPSTSCGGASDCLAQIQIVGRRGS